MSKSLLSYRFANLFQFLAKPFSTLRRRRIKSRSRRSFTKIEALENRLLLTASATRNIDPIAQTFTLTLSGRDDDAVTIRTTGTSLEWSSDGVNFTRDWDTSTPGDQLANVGDFQSLVITSQDPKITLGNLALPGVKLLVQGTTQIDVAATAIVTTRTLPGGVDAVTGASIGPSGDLKLAAPVIHVADGAKLLANADSGRVAGNVTLLAEDVVNGNVLDVLAPITRRETRAEIIIGAATILGNDISVSSLASNRKVLEMPEDLTKNSRAIATGDLNGDGKLDVVMGNYGQPTQVFFGDGTGNYGKGGIDINADAFNTTAVALADFNGDGKLDLLVGNYGQANRLYYGDGTGKFGPGVDIGLPAQTTSLVVRDFNGDGRPDVFVGNYGQANTIHLNQTGTLTTGVPVGTEVDKTQSVTAGDFNNDGKLDVLVGNDGANRIYAGDGTGGFTLTSFVDPYADKTQSVAVGDLNGDGNLDFVVGNNGVNRWYAGNGNFGFTPTDLTVTTTEDGQTVTTTPAEDTRSVQIVDWNGDGRLDILVGDYNAPVSIYRNDGVGNPFDSTVTLDGGVPVDPNPAYEEFGSDVFATAGTVADMDGDSRPDYLTAGDNQLGQVVLNKSSQETLTSLSPRFTTEEVEEKTILGFKLGASVNIADSGASVVVGSGSILTAARDIVVRADAVANITNITPSSVVGAGYGRAVTNASVLFEGADSAHGLSAATVTAGRDVDVSSSSQNTLIVIVVAIGIERAAVIQSTIAIGNADSHSETIVENGATISGRDVSFEAVNTNLFTVSAISVGLQPGNPNAEFGEGAGVGVGIAIGTMDSTANTRIDGRIIATGSVSAEALSTNVKNDTNASASVINQASIVGKLGKKMTEAGQSIATKYGSAANKVEVKGSDGKRQNILWNNDGLPIAVGAALTVAVANNEAHTLFGSTSDVTAANNLTGFSRAEDNTQTYAVGGAGEAGVAIGGAVNITVASNSSSTLVAPNARLDAGGVMDIRSEAVVPNQVDIFNLALDIDDNDDTGVDASGKVTRRFEDGLTVAEKLKFVVDSVKLLLTTSAVIGGTVGSTTAQASVTPSQEADGALGVAFGINISTLHNDSTATLQSGAQINQRIGAQANQDVLVEAFSHVETINLSGMPTILGITGETAGSLGNAAGGHLDIITHQTNARASIEDGARVTAGRDVSVVGSTFNFLLSATQAGGKSGGKTIEGAISVVSLGSDTYAYIEDQAVISAGHDVTVTADNDTTQANLGGTIVLSGQLGIGVGVALTMIDSNTHAFIGDNPYDNIAPVAPPKPINAGNNVSVKASSDQKLLNLALSGTVVAPFQDGPGGQEFPDENSGGGRVSGGKQETPDGKTFGIGVSADAAVIVLDDDVSAFITNPVNSGGDVSVNAENTTSSIVTSGALSLTAGVNAAPSGAGSLASNFVSKSALAYLGDIDVTAVGDVTVSSHATNTLVTVAASGSGSARASSVAGSVTINALVNNDRAVIYSGATINAGGAVTVNADNTSKVVVVTGAGAGAGTGAGVGAAVAINVLDETAIASVGGTISDTAASGAVTIHAGKNVAITAQSDDFSLQVSASLGLSLGGTGVGGTVSSETLTQDVQALVINGSTITTPQSMLIDSEANATLINIGGAGAGGKSAAVGATVTNTNLFRTNRAQVGEDVTIDAGGAGNGVLDRDLVTRYGLVVDATSNDEFVTVAVGAAVAAQGAAVGASLNVFTDESEINAQILHSAKINASNSGADSRQSVRVRAQKTTDMVSVAGGAGGSTLAGVGAAIDTQNLTRDVRATIDRDSIVNARNSVEVQAHNEEDATSVVLGIGVGTSAVGVAASVSTINISGDIDALIGDRVSINANLTNPPLGNSVNVSATNDTDLFSLGGAVGLGKQVGVGAGASAGSLDTEITARIGEGAQVKTSTSVVVNAASNEKILSFAANAGGGGTVGVAGSADVWNVEVDVNSSIGRSATVYSQGTVAVTADGSTSMTGLAGAISGAGNVGVGASVAVLILDKTVQANIGDAATITALGQRGGQMAADTLGVDYSAPDASKGQVAPSGDTTYQVNINGNSNSTVSETDPALTQHREATVLKRLVTGLIVTATNRNDMNTLAVSGAAAGQVAVAVGGAVSVATTTTAATIGNDVNINSNNTGAAANQDVHVVALNDMHHLGVTVGGSAAGVVAVSPGVDVVVVDSTTRAAIGDRTRVNATSNVTVLAKAVEKVLSISGGVAVSGEVGVAGMVAVPSITSRVFGSIGVNTVIDAGGSIAAIALDDTTVSSFVGSVGIGGGTAGVGGSVSVIVVSKQTEATVGQGSKLTSRGTSTATRHHNIDSDLDSPILTDHSGVIVYAKATEDIFNLVIAGGGGFAAGVAGAVGVTSLASNTLAQVGDNVTITAADDVMITAVNRADLLSIGGAAGGSFVAGVAGGVDVGVVQSQTSAIVGHDATLTAGDDLLVLALADKSVESYAVSFGAAAIAGVAAAVSVWSIGTSINDRFDNEDTVNDDRSGPTTSNNVLTLNGSTNSEYGTVPQYVNSMSGGQHSGGGYSQMLYGYSSTGDQQQLGSMTSSATSRINAASSRTQIDFSRHEGGGTQALIGVATKLTAGDLLAVEANEKLDFSSTTGSGAAGLAGVGASVTVLTFNELNQAVIGAFAQLTAPTISISANLQENVDGHAYAGQIAAAAIGAQVVVVTDNNSQLATIGDNAVVAGGSVSVIAHAERNVNLDAVGVAVSFGGTAGVALAIAKVGGYTVAHVGNNVDLGTSSSHLTGSVTVRAESNASISTASRSVGAGLGPFAVATGIGTNSTGKITSTIAAEIGGGTEVYANGSVTVEAVGLHNVSTEALAVAVALGVSVGASVSHAEIAPTIDTSVGNGAAIYAPTINVRTRFNHDGAGPLRDDDHANAYARGQAASGALVGGVAGTGVDAINAPSLHTTISSGAILSGTTVNVLTNASFEADAGGLAAAGALFVAVGISIVNARADGLAVTENAGTIIGQDVDLITNVSATSTADAVGIGGALLAGGVGSQSYAYASPTLLTRVSSTGTVRSSRSFDLKTLSRGTADSTTAAAAVSGVVSGGSMTTVAVVSPLVSTAVDSGATIQASGQFGMQMQALHNVDFTTQQPLSNVGANVDSGGLFASLVVSVSSATAVADAKAQVAATLNPSINFSGSSSLTVNATSANIALTDLDSRGGSLVSIQVADPKATAQGTTTASLHSNVSNTGSVTVQASSNDRSAVTLLAQNGGGINVGVSTATAQSGSTTNAVIGSNLTLALTGNLTVLSAGVSEADSTSRGGSGGIVTINSLDAIARSTPTVGSSIGDFTSITAGGKIALFSSAPVTKDTSDQTRADSGDGYTTAASATSSGGLVTIQDANSTATVNPTAINYIGNWTRLSANQIELTAYARTAQEALTVGAGGGLISVGGVDATQSQFTKVYNTIGQSSWLQAADTINMTATANLEGYGNSSANIGGLVAFTTANTQIDVDYQVHNQIGGASNISAGNSLNAEASTTVYAFGTSRAEAGGLGSNSRSSNSGGNPDASDLKGVRIGHQVADTSTEVFDNAQISANNIRLAATVPSMYARMESRSRAEGFGTDADSVANVDIFDTAQVVLYSNVVLNAINRVDLIANHSNLDATSFSRSVGASAFGDSDSTSITDVDSFSFVRAAAGSRVITHDFNAEATYQISNYDRRAENSGGIDAGSRNERGDFLTLQSFDWQGDLVINGTSRDRELIIAEDGSVESNKGVTYQTVDGVVYGIRDGLTYSPAQAGSVRFHSNPVGNFDGKFGAASSFTTSNFLSTTQPTFTFNDTINSINIIDRYTGSAPGMGTLLIPTIDVVSASASPVITLDVNNIPTTGTIFNVKREFQPTTVTIQSTRNVSFNTINNPIGSTTISAKNITFDTITSHNLDLDATGDVGTYFTSVVNNVVVTRLSNIQLTQTSAGSPSLEIDAGSLVMASITGLQRVNAPFVANIDHITGRRLTLEFNPAQSQYSNGGVGPVTVQKTQPGKEIILPTGTFTRSVNQVFVANAGFFGYNPDSQAFNSDVFGQSNGNQSFATYAVNGRIEAIDQSNSSTTVKPNSILQYRPFTESASLPTNFTPGASQQWADINGDGALDLVTASGSTLTILINDLALHNAFYVLQTIDNSQQILSFALGDIDQDGDIDIALQRGAAVRILKNINGTFSEDLTPLINPGYSGVLTTGDIAFADVDGNGYLDVIDAGSFAVGIHLFDASGNTSSIRSIFGNYSRLDVGDYDRDGDIDLLVGGNGNPTRIFLNDGNGNYADSGIVLPSTIDGIIKFGDSDGDGDLDVLILGSPNSNGIKTLSVYVNSGGTLNLRASMDGRISNVLWNDFDGDGDMDLLVHYTDPDSNTLYTNVGNLSNLSDPLFSGGTASSVPNGATLQGWSTAPLVDGHGAELLYLGQQNGQPYFKVFENLLPVADVTPAAPTNVSATAISTFATINWAGPAGTATSTSPYTYNLRIRHGSDVIYISTPAGDGAISANTFKLSDIIPGEFYYVSVQTVDSSGRRSGWSSEGTVVSSNYIYVNQAGDFDDGNASNNQTTLREAINLANSQPGNYRIQLMVSPGQLTSPLTITKSLTISGDGSQLLIGNGTGRLFNIDDGTSSLIDVKIEGVVLKGGRSDYGGAIRSTENLTLEGVTFDDNHATMNGGAVWIDVSAGGRVSVNGITSGVNTADVNGGLMYINNAGSLSITGGGITNAVSGTLTGNSAGNNGGTYYINNTATGQIQTNYARVLYSQAAQSGGGVYVSNSGQADLSGFQTQSNTAQTGGGIYLNNLGGNAIIGNRQNFNRALTGGGIMVSNTQGTVIARGLSLENNTADYDGGGLWLYQTGGTSNLNAMYVENNKTLQNAGGAITLINNGGVQYVTSSLFRTNQAQQGGGAINYVGDGGGTITISGNTFIGNRSTQRGIVAAHVNGGTFNVSQNTFSANTVSGTTDSSSISVLAFGSSYVNIIANTLAYNDSSASANAGVIAVSTPDGGASILVASNLLSDNILGSGAQAMNVSGPHTRFDSNWVGDNAGLLPLSFSQGGLVPTYSLAPNSPAINQGSDPSLLPQYDQRGQGFARAVGRPDIGAIEAQAPGSHTYVVSTLSDDVDGDISDGQLSLAEAIRLANASKGEDTIIFSPAIYGGTISQSGSSLLYGFQDVSYVITDDLKIIGPGIGLIALSSRTYKIDDGDVNHQINVEFSGLTITRAMVGFSSTENTTLRDVSITNGSAIVARPEAGATFHVINSFIDQSSFKVFGPGNTVIDSSTIVAPNAVQDFLGVVPLSIPSIIADPASRLLIRNSTLLGRRQATAFDPLVITPTTGGIQGPATVISSIIPYLGAGSTAINSLIANGDPAGLAGTSSTSTITIDATAPTLPVILSPSPLTNDSTPTLSGTADANVNITIVVDPDSNAATLNSFTLTTTTNVTGQWSIDIPAQYALLSGQHVTFKVTAVDAAGNSSPVATSTFDVDTIAPAAPIVVIPSTVATQTPTFRGMAEPGSTVTVNMPAFSLSTTLAVNADGSFEFTAPQSDFFYENAHVSIAVSFTATDAAGNVSSTTSGSYFTDTQPPIALFLDNQTSITSATPNFSGRGEDGQTVIVTIDPDNNPATSNSFSLSAVPAGALHQWFLTVPPEFAFTNGSTVHLTIVSVDSVGNTTATIEKTLQVDLGPTQSLVITSPSLVNTNTPKISGTLQGFENITVVIDPDNDPATDNSFQLVGQTDNNGFWSVTIPVNKAIADGATLSFVATSNGNGHPTASGTITVDSTPPDAPLVSFGNWVTSTTPTLSGTAEPLTKIELILDPDDNSATYNSVRLTTTTLADGTWSIAIPISIGLQNGSLFNVAIRAIDSALSVSEATTVKLRVDTTAPNTPVLFVTPVMNSVTPKLAGSADPFSTITLVIDPDNDPATDNSVTLTTTASAFGQFSVDYPIAFLEGTTASVVVTATDLAGNATSSATATFTITLSVPEVSPPVDQRVSVNGGTTSDTTPTIYGTGRPGGVVRIFIDPDRNSQTNNTLIFSTTVGNDGTWSFTVPDLSALADGSTASLVVVQSDLNGNLIGSATGAGVLDPRLGIVSFLGGNIATASLQLDSPAIDAGSNPLGLIYDVRGIGFARVNGSAADIGSYELQPAVFTVTVDSEDDNGDYSPDDLSFREAIKLANLNPGVDTIRFAANLTSVPISLTSPDGVTPYNPLTQHYFPNIAITESVNIEGRADRSLTFTTTQQGLIETNPGQYAFGPLFTIDDGQSGKTIDVRISGVTLSSNIVSHENLTLENVTFAAGGDYRYLLSTANLTLRDVDINNWTTIIATGSGVDSTTITLEDVTINASVTLNVNNASLILDKLHINASDIDYGPLGVPLGSYVTNNGLVTNAKNVALTVRDSDYRTAVGYLTNSGITYGAFSGFPWSYLRFLDANGNTGENPANSLVLENSQINGWTSPAVATANVTTAEDTPIDIDLRTYAVLGNGDPAGQITGVSNAVGGTVELLADGYTARFHPNADFNGTASFEYSVATVPVAKSLRDYPILYDSTGFGTTTIPANSIAIARATIKIGVTAVDDPFTVHLSPVDATEDQSQDIDLWTFVSDVDSPLSHLTFTLGSTSNTQATLLADGHTVRLTFAQDYFGPASFTFNVTDGTTTFNNQSVAVTVAAVNDVSRVVVPVTQQMRDIETLALSGVSVSDVDSSSISVTVSVTSGALRYHNADSTQIVLNGSPAEINAQLAEILFVPQAGIQELVQVSIVANDGSTPQTATFLIQVGINTAPLVGSDRDTITVTEGTTATQTGYFNDLNGDAVTVTASIGNITQDADGNWSWSYTPEAGPEDTQVVTITATDSLNAVTTTNFNLVVTNIPPTPPIDSDDAANTVSEGAHNGDTVGVTASSSDVPGDTITYTLTDDAGGRFAIDSVTGVVTVKDATLLDFESATSHTITVKASDGGDFKTQQFAITVTNMAPATPTDSDAAANAVSEGAVNGEAVGITVTAPDIHGGQVIFTLTQDAGGRFQIDAATGIITVKDGTLLNYESATSHTITVQATDGTDSSTQDFIIAVTNVAPTTPIDGDNSINTVSEGATNGTAVGITATSTDIHGGTVTYSLTNDAGGRFQIDSATGVVTVKEATLLNYESATSHTITIQATDGTNGATQDFTIAVTNMAPTVPVDGDNAANAVSEGATNGATVGVTAVSSDVHGGTITYSLINHADGRFQIDSTTGVVTVKDATRLNYEDATSHTITVSATDGTAAVTQQYTIAVTNMAPTQPVDSNGAVNTVSEGVVTDATVGITAVATDIHGGTVTFSLADDAGGRFQINPTTGVVTVKDATLLDFETATSHDIVVQASDGTASSTERFTISITNVAPTQPSDTNSEANTVSEGAQNGDLVGITATATDIHGGTVTYSLTDDAGGRFQIHSATGVVSVKDATLLDYESAMSHTITVVATDGTASSQQQFTISVTNLPPTQPVDSNDAVNSVPQDAVQGTTVGITATSTDSHGGAVTYSLTNDDGGRFQIDSHTGAVTVKNPGLLIFEGGTSHTITVQATDGTNASVTQNFTIAVTAVAPIVGSTTVDRSANGVLTITDTLAFNNDNLTLSLHGGNLRITDSTTTFGGPGGIDVSTPGAVELAMSLFTQIAIDTKDKADVLTVDFTSGNPIPAGGLSYDGGASTGNGLVINNAGLAFTKTIVRPLSSTSGTIEFITGDTHTFLSYTHVSFVRMDGTESSDVVFDLSNGSNRATLTDGSAARDGRMRFSVVDQIATEFSVTGIQTLTIQGNNGDDVLVVSSLDQLFSGQVILDGGSGNDTLNASTSPKGVTLIGGIGNDTLIGSAFDDYMDGGDGNDRISGNAGNDLLLGGAGDDVISGGAGDDTISGGAGRDTLSGDGGNDVISGGAGDDLIRGGDGDDTLLGDAGKDRLLGGKGVDRLIAGNDSDRDTLSGGSAPKGTRNIINGDTRRDTITGSKKEIDTTFMFDFDAWLTTIKRLFGRV